MSLRSRFIVLLLIGLVVTLQGCAGAVVVGGATAGAMANDRRSSGAYVDDELIEWKLFDVLDADEQIREQTHLNTVSFNGVVLLTGEVPNEMMRARAIELISGVEGVRAVHDETSIAAPSSIMSRTGDSWITTKLKTALLAEDADIGASTKVVTEKGVVYLMGIVSPEEADKLADIVRRVGGVQKVVKVFEYQS
jgi:osmotically-inducible protein OsmY